MCLLLFVVVGGRRVNARLLHEELRHGLHVKWFVFQKKLTTLRNAHGKERTARNSFRFKIASRTMSVILGEKSSRQMARIVFVFSRFQDFPIPTCEQIEEGLHKEIGEPSEECTNIQHNPVEGRDDVVTTRVPLRDHSLGIQYGCAARKRKEPRFRLDSRFSYSSTRDRRNE